MHPLLHPRLRLVTSPHGTTGSSLHSLETPLPRADMHREYADCQGRVAASLGPGGHRRSQHRKQLERSHRCLRSRAAASKADKGWQGGSARRMVRVTRETLRNAALPCQQGAT